MSSSRLLKNILVLSCSLIFITRASGQTDSGYVSSFDGVKIHYEARGSGAAVLLIHGFTGKGSDWKTKPVYDSLVAAGFRVITADLRGNGLSDKPHQAESYANDAEAKDLVMVLKHLGVKSYKAIGYSRGSIILARLLVLDKNITGAVIGGMGADFTNPQWPRRIGLYNALISDTSTGFEDFKKRIASSGLDRLALAYQQKEQPSTSPEELGRVQQKVLLLCGDKDEDNGRAQDLQKLIPGSIFMTVPGNHGSAAGTKEFASACLHFLKS